jgi:NaMN:DMB phosphoribosyltransferase
VTESVEQLLSRIVPFSPQPTQPLSDSVTGSLAELVEWWQQRAPKSLEVATVNTQDGSSFAHGVDHANHIIDSGSTLLILTSSSNVEWSVTRAIVGLLTRKDAFAVSFHPPGVTDQDAMADIASIRDHMREHGELRGAPKELAQLSSEVDFTTGLLLTASARNTPVITGNITHLAAALIGNRLSMAASKWWRHGATSPDSGVIHAVERLGIAPGLPLGLSDSLGMGAKISASILTSLLVED